MYFTYLLLKISCQAFILNVNNIRNTSFIYSTVSFVHTYVCFIYDLDFILGFDNISYEVNTKNQPDIPIIKFHTLPEYDSQYDHTLFFPIGMTIQEVDGTAIGKLRMYVCIYVRMLGRCQLGIAVIDKL